MQFGIQRWLVLFVVLGALFVGGCSTTSQTNSEGSSTATSDAAPITNVEPQADSLPRLEGKATVEMIVKGSPVVIEVDGTNAPITAGNFVDLVQRGFYDGLAFHRVVRQPPELDIVQGGDPQSKDPNFPPQQLGTGGFIDPETSAPRFIPLEIKPKGSEQPVYGETLFDAGVETQPELSHRPGAVAMARSQAPNSASSQFYIAVSDQRFLDGRYAVFGYVTSGMEVVQSIQQGDVIESATVTQGAENLKRGASS